MATLQSINFHIKFNSSERVDSFAPSLTPWNHLNNFFSSQNDGKAAMKGEKNVNIDGKYWKEKNENSQRDTNKVASWQKFLRHIFIHFFSATKGNLKRFSLAYGYSCCLNIDDISKTIQFCCDRKWEIIDNRIWSPSWSSMDSGWKVIASFSYLPTILSIWF